MKHTLPFDFRIAAFIAVFVLAGGAFFLAQLCQQPTPPDGFLLINDTDFTMEVTVGTFRDLKDEVVTLKPGASAQTRILRGRDATVAGLQNDFKMRMVRISFRNVDRGLTLEGAEAGRLAAEYLLQDPGKSGGKIALSLQPVLKAMENEGKK